MARKAQIQMFNRTAGWLTEDENGYHYVYDSLYLRYENAMPVSVTFPLRVEAFSAATLFPFFDGLIPEGWLLEIATNNWKLNQRDRMGLLLVCCEDCIGAVSVYPVNDVEDD